MNASLVWILLSTYFGLNLLFAVGLHLLAQRQAHLPLRFLDVAVHFVLLTLLALPVLAVVMLWTLFSPDEGEREAPEPRYATPAARAA